MTTFRYLPVAGAVLAASLAVAACGNATAGQSGPRASTPPASSSAAATTPPATGAAPAGGPAPTASPAAERAGFAGALAAWKQAAAAPAAVMNEYLLRAAGDLREAGRASYGTAISELTYLAHVPLTNVPAAQRAAAQADVRALDRFFGTPGLMS